MATADVDAGRIRFIASASLRDRFACAAMQPLVETVLLSASALKDDTEFIDIAHSIAQRAYEMADAMLAERTRDSKEAP